MLVAVLNLDAQGATNGLNVLSERVDLSTLDVAMLNTRDTVLADVEARCEFDLGEARRIPQCAPLAPGDDPMRCSQRMLCHDRFTPTVRDRRNKLRVRKPRLWARGGSPTDSASSVPLTRADRGAWQSAS